MNKVKRQTSYINKENIFIMYLATKALISRSQKNKRSQQGKIQKPNRKMSQRQRSNSQRKKPKRLMNIMQGVPLHSN